MAREDRLVAVYQYGELAVSAEVPSEEIAERVAHYMSLPYSIHQDFGKTDISVVPVTGGYHFSHRSIADPCETEDQLVIYMTSCIAHEIIRRLPDSLLHAGAIVSNGRAVLFSGDSYVGKSTLALHAWREGLLLMGDDWLFFDSGDRNVRALPKPIKPRTPVAGHWIDSLADSEHATGDYLGENRLMIPRARGFHNRYRVGVPIGHLVFIERGVFTKLMPLTVEEATRRMLEQTVLGEIRLNLEGIRLLQSLWSEDRVHKLTICNGDFSNAIEIMLSLP